MLVQHDLAEKYRA